MSPRTTRTMTIEATNKMIGKMNHMMITTTHRSKVADKLRHPATLVSTTLQDTSILREKTILVKRITLRMTIIPMMMTMMTLTTIIQRRPLEDTLILGRTAYPMAGKIGSFLIEEMMRCCSSKCRFERRFRRLQVL